MYSRLSERIENLRKNVKNLFLADYIIDFYDDKEFKDEIHRVANRELISFFNSKSKQYYDPIIIPSLVFIATEKYNAEFYYHLQEYYPQLFEKYSDQKIQSEIRKIIDKHFRHDEIADNKSYVGAILSQTFVPIHYLGDFYEFLFDIYKDTFQYSILTSKTDKESDDGYKEMVRIVFKSLFIDNADSNEKDELVYELDTGKKLYRLIVSTKRLLSNMDNLLNVLPVIEHMFEIIHNHYWGYDNTELLSNSYYRTGFEDWNRRNSEQIRSNTNTVYRNNLIPTFSHYNVYNNSVVLRTKAHISPNYVLGDRLRIQVLNNGKVIKNIESELIIKKVLGGYSISPQSIEVINPLGELTYEVLRNDEIEYSTGTKLHKDSLIFNSDYTYTTNLEKLLNENTLIISNQKLNFYDFLESKQNSFWKYTGILDSQNLAILNSSEIAFLKVSEPKVIGEIYPAVKAYRDDLNIELFRKVKTLLFRTSQKMNRVSVIVNNINYSKVTDIKALYEDGYYNYAFNIENVISRSGYYEIKIKNEDKIEAEFRFIVDKEFNYTFEQAEKLKFILSTDLFKNHIIVIEMELDALEELKVDIPLNEQTLTYEIDYPIIRYQLDNEKGYHLLSDYIWFKDNFNTVTIHNLDLKRIDVYGDKYLSQLNIKLDEYPAKVPKNIIDEIYRSNSDIFKLTLHLHTTNRQRKYLTILSKNELNSNDVSIYNDNKYFYIVANFKGKNKTTLVITSNGNPILRKVISTNEEVKIPLIYLTRYSIEIFEGDNSFFASQQKRILFQAAKVFYDNDYIINRSLNLISGSFNPDDEFHSILRTFIFIEKKIDNDIYQGYIYYKVMMDSREYILLENVKVELLENISEEFFHVSIVDEDNDGIYYHKRRKTIMAQAKYNDRNVSDIFEYKVKLTKGV